MFNTYDVSEVQCGTVLSRLVLILLNNQLHRVESFVRN